jgi:hypothetical protein
MSIESDAQQDLSLTDEDAENVAGGKKTKHAAKPKPATHQVNVISSPGFTGPDQPTQYVTGNMGDDDCADGSEVTT